MGRNKTPPEGRFFAKVSPASSDPLDCWQWTGATNSGGYGKFSSSGSPGYAHRWAWAHFNGPIPDGLVIDHLCRNRSCVNPWHMEPVTQKVNVRRSDRSLVVVPRGPNRRPRPLKGLCKRGHSLKDAYQYPNSRRRDCLTCRRARAREWARRKAANAI